MQTYLYTLVFVVLFLIPFSNLTTPFDFIIFGEFNKNLNCFILTYFKLDFHRQCGVEILLQSKKNRMVVKAMDNAYLKLINFPR